MTRRFDRRPIPREVLDKILAAGTTPIDNRWSDSSNGLIMDNSQPIALSDGHVRFVGDRLGIYHPTPA